MGGQNACKSCRGEQGASGDYVAAASDRNERVVVRIAHYALVNDRKHMQQCERIHIRRTVPDNFWRNGMGSAVASAPASGGLGIGELDHRQPHPSITTRTCPHNAASPIATLYTSANAGNQSETPRHTATAIHNGSQGPLLERAR